MGIDIEMYVETFDGERWRPSEPLVENEDYDPVDDPSQPKLRPQCIFPYRVRPLFAALREDIAPCRGLPPDVSPEVADFERPRHRYGLFDHSWLTLEELLAFDWTGKLAAEDSGLFCEEVLPKLQTFGPPRHVRIVFWFNA